MEETTDPYAHLHPFKRRHPQESKAQHRGLLLYTMMDEDKRSLRLVSRVVNRSDAAIRQWRQKFDWDSRISKVGEAAQQLALREYGASYGEYLVNDASGIERNMSIPFRPELLPPEPASGDKDDPNPRMGARGPATRASIKAKLGSEADAVKETVTSTQRLANLLEAILGRAAQQVKDNKMRVNARDLPALIRAHQELQGLLDGTPKDLTNTVQPSVRVVAAQQSGGDIADAMLQDARECVAILQGIQASKQIAAEMAQAKAEAGEQEEPQQEAQ